MISNLLEALSKIGREKGIEQDFLLETIELALQSASRKKMHLDEDEKRVVIEETETGLAAFILKTVVEQVENSFMEISLAEAQEVDPSAELGAEIKIEFDPQLLGRNAAQTAKQVIIQRIQEAERENVYNEYKDRLYELVTATVQRVEPRYVILMLGQCEALLPFKEQAAGEKYFIGERLKVLIIEVRRANKGTQVVVSRSHPKIVKDLFVAEVPEISDGIIEIKAITREAGERTKIAVSSIDKNIDPVGACVGIRGQRVQAIVKELRGEKIDIIEWAADQVEFIKHSLSPAEIAQVILNDKEKSAQVVVADSQLSLAIGKKGQNVRLTAKLTAWKIDIIKEQDFKAQEKSKIDQIFGVQAPAVAESASLGELIGEKVAEKLAAAEVTTSDAIIALGVEGLTQIKGIGPKSAEKILAAVDKGAGRE